MPIEMRRLVFSESELAEAVNRLLKAEWSKIQVDADRQRAMMGVSTKDGGGEVLSLRTNDAEPLVFEAMIETRQGNKIKREFSAAEMMDLLIGYCRAANIPLARAAEKSLKRAKIGYALDLTIRKWGGKAPKDPNSKGAA